MNSQLQPQTQKPNTHHSQANPRRQWANSPREGQLIRRFNPKLEEYSNYNNDTINTHKDQHQCQKNPMDEAKNPSFLEQCPS